MATEKDITIAVKRILASAEDSFIDKPQNEEDSDEKFNASDWLKTDDGQTAYKAFKKALKESEEEFTEEDDLEEDDDEEKVSKKAKKASTEELDEEDEEEKTSKKANKAKKASTEELDEEDENDLEIKAAVLDVIDEFIESLDIEEDEDKLDAKKSAEIALDKFTNSAKCKACVKRIKKALADENPIGEEDDEIKEADREDFIYNDDEDLGVTKEEFNDIKEFFCQNAHLILHEDESVCPVCGKETEECTCEIEEEDDDDLFLGKTSKKSKKAKKASGEDIDEEDELDEEDEDSKDESEDIDEEDEESKDEDEDLNEEESDEEKIAKRAEYNAKRRAKRRAEKLFNDWKAAYKAKRAEAGDIDEEDDEKPEGVAKKVKAAAKARAQAVEEAFNDILNVSGKFGNLSESESRTIKTDTSKIVNKFLKEAEIKIANDAIKAANAQIKKSVIPTIVNQFNTYVESEVKPELYKQFESYIEYVAKNIYKRLKENKLVVRSKSSAQLTEFTDSLIGLIESKLHIMPKREDALTVLENKVSSISTLLEDEKIKKIRAQKKLAESQKEIWILKNIPTDISESRRETLKKTLLEIDSSLSYDEFIVKGNKVLSNLRETIDNKYQPKTSSTINKNKDLQDPFDIATNLF